MCVYTCIFMYMLDYTCLCAKYKIAGNNPLAHSNGIIYCSNENFIIQILICTEPSINLNVK